MDDRNLDDRCFVDSFPFSHKYLVVDLVDGLKKKDKIFLPKSYS